MIGTSAIKEFSPRLWNYSFFSSLDIFVRNSVSNLYNLSRFHNKTFLSWWHLKIKIKFLQRNKNSILKYQYLLRNWLMPRNRPTRHFYQRKLSCCFKMLVDELQVFLDPHLFKLSTLADLFLCIARFTWAFIQKNIRDRVPVLCRCHKRVIRVFHGNISC